MENTIHTLKPTAANPHVRFDEGDVASATPRRGSLLYIAERKDLAIEAAAGIPAAKGHAFACVSLKKLRGALLFQISPARWQAISVLDADGRSAGTAVRHGSRA